MKKKKDYQKKSNWDDDTFQNSKHHNSEFKLPKLKQQKLNKKPKYKKDWFDSDINNEYYA